MNEEMPKPAGCQIVFLSRKCNTFVSKEIFHMFALQETLDPNFILKLCINETADIQS